MYIAFFIFEDDDRPSLQEQCLAIVKDFSRRDAIKVYSSRKQEVIVRGKQVVGCWVDFEYSPRDVSSGQISKIVHGLIQPPYTPDPVRSGDK